MKRSITVIISLFVMALFILDSVNIVEGVASHKNKQQVASTAGFYQEQDIMDKYIAQVKEMIKGKEDLPAKDVYKNLKIDQIKNMPASRVISIMRIAFANSLGTDCMHCHVKDDWASDEKKQKDITRGMWQLMGETSAKVKEITGNETAFVNCTICHSGSIIPGTPNPKE